jgi:hypothetical protein
MDMETRTNFSNTFYQNFFFFFTNSLKNPDTLSEHVNEGDKDSISNHFADQLKHNHNI